MKKARATVGGERERCEEIHRKVGMACMLVLPASPAGMVSSVAL